jgi:stage V sporulation protein G
VDITEVRIKLTEDLGERLKAFCSITFDNCFVVRDLKIIEGANGPFVAMPSRKLTFHCPQCRGKNHLRAGYCNQCGASLKEHQPPADEEGRIKLYADIAHPINSYCRELIQDEVIAAYQQEIEAAKRPGYVSHYDDFDEDWDQEPPTESKRTRSEAEPPRGPHRKPATSKAASGPPPRQRPPDTFGAGVFS